MRQGGSAAAGAQPCSARLRPGRHRRGARRRGRGGGGADRRSGDRRANACRARSRNRNPASEAERRAFGAAGNVVGFSHPCEVCGNPVAPFGFGVQLLRGQVGEWFCSAHVGQRQGHAQIRRERARTERSAAPKLK